ncbi:hypothetical protein ACWEF6_06830 [Amycolatopsis sp. NPDC004772]
MTDNPNSEKAAVALPHDSSPKNGKDLVLKLYTGLDWAKAGPVCAVLGSVAVVLAVVFWGLSLVAHAVVGSWWLSSVIAGASTGAGAYGFVRRRGRHKP